MSDETTIHGENATSLAAILEYIQLPNHPMHADAVARANAFVEAERQVKLEAGRKAMQEALDAEETAEEVDGPRRPTPEDIERLCEALTELANDSFKRSGDNVNTVKYVPSAGGRAYTRIVRQSFVHGRHASDSAHTFVKMDDGTLWKPASWKGPAKNFPRGSVFELPGTHYVGNI